MKEKLSRRDLTKAALAGASALAVTPLGLAQSTPQPSMPDTSVADTAEAAGELKVKLTDDVKKLLTAQTKEVRKLSVGRLKYPLKDCSEPSFVFHAEDFR